MPPPADADVSFSDATAALLPSSCAELMGSAISSTHTATKGATNFLRKRIPIYGCTYATVRATDDATWAACRIVVKLRGTFFGARSGTTMESPGFKTAFSGSPDQNPALFLDATTEPSARTTKTAFRSPICVKPPA